MNQKIRSIWTYQKTTNQLPPTQAETPTLWNRKKTLKETDPTTPGN